MNKKENKNGIESPDPDSGPELPYAMTPTRPDVAPPYATPPNIGVGGVEKVEHDFNHAMMSSLQKRNAVSFEISQTISRSLLPIAMMSSLQKRNAVS